MSEKIPRHRKDVMDEDASAMETESLGVAPVDEYMELIQNMYKDQPIPPEVQTVYWDIRNSAGYPNATAKAIDKLRGFVAERQKITGDLSPALEADPIIANPEEALDQEEVQNPFSNEGTRLEWKNTLRGLIEGAKEKLGMGERVEKMKGYFSGRSEELDKESVGYGSRIENFIRAKGAEYNKLSFKKKLLIGGILGIGAATFSTVSTPLATAFAINMGIQRAAGMASMFMKIESHLKRFDTPIFDDDSDSLKQKKQKRDEMSNKALAAVLATGYTVLAGALIGGAVHYASESSAGHAVHEWLQQHYPFNDSEVPAQAPEAAHAATVPASAPAPESAGHAAAQAETSTETADKPAAAAAAGGEATPHGGTNTIPDTAPKAEVKLEASTASEAGTIDMSEIKPVKAPGHGYEYMMKRLWEQLQEKDIKLPKNSGDTSDLARLLEVEKGDEAGINKLVHKLAEEKGWYKSDGTSVRIDADSAMTINSEGEISVGENISAPEDAPVTPVYHPEAPITPSAGGTEASDEALKQYFGAEPEAPLSEPPHADVGSSGIISETQVTHAGEAPTSSEVSPTNPESTVISNIHNVRIQTAEAHIYGDRLHPADRFVYGGSGEQKMKILKEYLTKIKDTSATTVYAADAHGHRVPWTLNEAGDLIKGPPVRYGFWDSFEKPPDPQKFTKIIK